MPGYKPVVAIEARLAKSAARHAEIAELAQQGLGVGAIARQLRVSRKTVYNAVGPLNTTLYNAAERRERILDMSRQGLAVDTIADKLRVNRRTVQRVRSLAGIAQRYTPIGSEEVSRAEALLDDGASYHEVGRTLGRCSKNLAVRLPGYTLTVQEKAERGAFGRQLAKI